MFYTQLDRNGVVVWKNHGPPNAYRGSQIGKPIWDLAQCGSRGHVEQFYRAVEKCFSGGDQRIDYTLLTPNGWQKYNTWFFRTHNGIITQGMWYPPSIESLPDQELRILRLMGQRLETSEIAAQMHVQPSTIRSHYRCLLERLKMPDANSLANLARLYFGGAQ